MENSCVKHTFLGTNSKMSTWKPLLRQIFVSSGVTVNIFIYGLYFGAPTVFIPQIRKQVNSTEVIGIEKESLLFSISSYGSLPWAIIYPIIADKFGRKIPYIVLWTGAIVSVSLFYFSESYTELFFSGFLQGMYLSINKTVAIMVHTEYTSPKYRGIFITFKSAMFFLGIWISNAIGTFYHWKNIGILIFMCCIYTIGVLFWPESPVWLATRGRFEECAKSHRWLKGDDTDSEEELKQLILAQKENLRREQRERQKGYPKNCAIRLWNCIISKTFYRPMTYSLYMILLYHFSGKLACTGYIIYIIKKITVNESIAYKVMLVLDGVTVFGMFVGVFLNKLLKRRTLLLGSASTGVFFLFILSTYLYLVHMNFISENKYLSLFFLMGFSLAISCGPMLMCKCLPNELTPIKSRSLYLSIYALTNNVIMGTVLKLFPYILKYFDSYGALFFCAFMSSVFICILYKILPETKDKTILEIENYLSDVVKEEKEMINLKEGRI